MRTQSEWLDIFKNAMCIKSDYQLAQRWRVERSYISQYRRERMRLPLAFVLDMAASMNIEAIEIIASIEYKRARKCDKQIIHDKYWQTLKRSTTARLDLAGGIGRQYYRR